MIADLLEEKDVSSSPDMRMIHAMSAIHVLKERDLLEQVPTQQEEEITTNNQFTFSIDFSLTPSSPIDDILADLRDLLKEDEQDECGILRPTKHALSWTVVLIISAYLEPNASWPFGCVSTDSAGGIRIEWRSQKGDIRLIVHASDEKKNYIYHQFANEHDVDTNVHPKNLIQWLNRLV